MRRISTYHRPFLPLHGNAALLLLFRPPRAILVENKTERKTEMIINENTKLTDIMAAYPWLLGELGRTEPRAKPFLATLN